MHQILTTTRHRHRPADLNPNRKKHKKKSKRQTLNRTSNTAHKQTCGDRGCNKKHNKRKLDGARHRQTQYSESDADRKPRIHKNTWHKQKRSDRKRIENTWNQRHVTDTEATEIAICTDDKIRMRESNTEPI